MGKLLYYELIKTFFKKRTYIGFLIAAIIVPLVEVAIKFEGDRFLQVATRRLQEDFFFIGNLFNGWFVSYQIMNALWVHVPLLISFVAGDLLAGEATAGTYRLLLIRPVSRTRIFLAKLGATVLYTFSFVSFLGVLSVGLALALLDSGDMIVIENGILILEESSVAWRFLVAFLLAVWPMLTIASIALLFSSFVDNAIGPIVATMGVLIVFLVLTVLPLEAFDSIRDGFFTKHMVLWQKVFADPIPWDDIQHSAIVLGIYTVVSCISAWVIFVKRDILS
ncbi:MAG: ABC transporter permease [Ignavibacteriae bacterium]|nr:ABC transporter permease [Ignavibacteriota bacterium]